MVRLLLLQERILEANKFQASYFRVQINKENAIRIDCNIVSGSYTNGKPYHIIHDFFPTVAPGYKIVEYPQK